uniref:Uncharacterized protein n=1 Tax=candidate division WOR-3 bacterium TaxID=2052148 RepID=A0A7C4YHG2_UNCW3
MKRLIGFLIIIGIIGYGVYVLIEYVQMTVKKRSLEEKVKESIENVYSGMLTIEKARSDLVSFITEKNINVDTTEIKIDKTYQFTYIYIPYYDSVVLPFFKKNKIYYFDYEIAETLYVK